MEQLSQQQGLVVLVVVVELAVLVVVAQVVLVAVVELAALVVVEQVVLVAVVESASLVAVLLVRHSTSVG